jgi:hypothetical protein
MRWGYFERFGGRLPPPSEPRARVESITPSSYDPITRPRKWTTTHGKPSMRDKLRDKRSPPDTQDIIRFDYEQSLETFRILGITVYDQRNTQIMNVTRYRARELEELLPLPLNGHFEQNEQNPKNLVFLWSIPVWADTGLALIYGTVLVAWALLIMAYYAYCVSPLRVVSRYNHRTAHTTCIRGAPMALSETG